MDRPCGVWVPQTVEHKRLRGPGEDNARTMPSRCDAPRALLGAGGRPVPPRGRRVLHRAGASVARRWRDRHGRGSSDIRHLNPDRRQSSGPYNLWQELQCSTSPH